MAFEREDYSSVLEEVRCFTSNADYSIINLECPVVLGDGKPITKNGPCLRCSPYGVKAINYAGFKCASLANNHFLDYGEDGVRQTLDSLNSQGIDHVGGGMSIEEASRVLYKDLDGQRIAIINCCEHEFSIATRTTAGSNPLNPIQQYYKIRDARANADRVLVIVHGGHEHFQLPSPRMVETYRFFIDAGADAVVGHHQHCFSGYEIYKGKPVFYGLGNFCFDSLKNHGRKWTEGYLVLFDFALETPDFSVIPYRQCADRPRIEILPDNSFKERIVELNAIIGNPELLNSKVEEYFTSCVNQYSSIFEPFMNRFYLGAIHRGFLPSLVGRRRKLVAANFVVCESHRDKLIHYLMNR